MKKVLSVVLGLALICGSVFAETVKYRKLNTDAVVEGTNKYYTDARARAAVSSTATGLTYTGATGVFSLTSGYAIPATDVIWPIANGGTNASSFATSNGLTYYNGTALVNNANLTYDGNLLTVTGDITVTDLLSFDEASWTGGRVIYVPATGDLATYYAASTAGDTLKLSANATYTIASQINLTKSITVEGCGVNSTVITMSADANMFTPSAGTSICFRDLSLTHTGTGEAVRSFFLTTATTQDIYLSLNNVNMTSTGATKFYCLNAYNASVDMRDIKISITGENNAARAFNLVYDSSGASARVVNIDNVVASISTTRALGADACSQIYDVTSSQSITVNLNNCYITSDNASANDTFALYALGDGVNVTAKNCYFNGDGFDVKQANSSVVTLSNCTLANNTTSGSITYRTWTAWTPTLTWATGTPASVTTVARYTVTDGICHFTFRTTSADSNGCTGLTVTLPITPKDINTMHAVTSRQLNDATWLDPMGYIDMTDNTPANRLLTFHGFATVADGATVTVEVSGEYEI
jgi:hypothetical protein